MLLMAALSQRGGTAHEVQRNLCRMAKQRMDVPGFRFFESTVDAA